ncbi:acyltransferase domain-containing protein [Stappia sp. BW2]|uniref:acyltransferase domain-containing protein n=1 Tax=Stappia sp. BW2 TaxID=2592622 RepID=UPI0013968EF3|nr:acyltransferase domain-containing protein [Stappia sp. BW2]
MRSNSSALPTAFCFAGQGSQYYHMAVDLFNTAPVFRQWMEIGDRIVKTTQGFSPLEIIYSTEHSLSDPFDHLEHSHPALFMTQFAAAKLLQSKGIRPDLLLGVSLGEFVAMSLAGMLPFEKALKVLAHQPSVFRGTTSPGALIAILAPEQIHEQSQVLRETTEIAGMNAERHCVLAAPEVETDRVIAELRRLDIPFQRLPVPFAFHSRWIETAQDDYLNAVKDVSFETPFWPVWSACLGAQTEAADGSFLWRIVREPMRLRATIAAIEARGSTNYIDLSPTGTFTAILRQEVAGGSSSSISALMSPFGGDLKRLDALVRSSPDETALDSRN